MQVASSPSFVQKQDWLGINPDVLDLFSSQLKIDPQTLMHRFLALQNMGLRRPKFSVKKTLELLLEFPMCSADTLEKTLKVLANTDLRNSLEHTNKPCMRIYGQLDSLVPVKVVDKISSLCISSSSHIIEEASHAPFLSHPEQVCELFLEFLNELGLSRFIKNK